MVLFIFFLLLISVFNTDQHERFNTSLKFHRKKQSFAAVIFSKKTNFTPSDKESCEWLRRLKHQNKICWKHKGLAGVLLEARKIAISQCEKLFEFERWNCSKREFFFKNFYRETAFMYSLTSSAVMFTVAKACANDSLKICKCGVLEKCRNLSERKQKSGCSDNTIFAKKFTKKFLQMKKKGDIFNSLAKFNTEVGIKAVLDNEETICQCLGITKPCPLEVCEKRLRPFEIIAKQLQHLYYNATEIKTKNNIRDLDRSENDKRLLYLESSPNFCPSTVGRYCSSKENCATLCCGRGDYPTKIKFVNHTCDCRWSEEKFNVDCQACIQKKTVLTCK